MPDTGELTTTPEPGTVCRYGPQDEVLHDPGSAATYNESAYLNFAAGPATDGLLGGVLRVGLRPNEGYSQFYLCLPMSDGSTLYWSARSPLDAATFPVGRTTWTSSSLTMDVLDPGRTWRITYEDEQTRRVVDPGALDHVGRALNASDAVRCRLDLTFTADRPLHVMQPTGEMIPGQDAAKDHYEQFGTVSGTLVVGDRTYPVSAARSFRDHSWGPRDYVSAMSDMDWFNLSLDGGPDFVGYRINSRPDLSVQGVRIDGAGAAFLDDVVVRSDWTGLGAVRGPLSIEMAVAGERVTMDVEVVRAVMIRHRSAEQTVHNTFGLVRVRAGDLGGGGWLDLNRPAAVTGAAAAASRGFPGSRPPGSPTR
ncbi:DUF7064 domain-containing protein [Pseudonocardia pini]|uniref:DUF7064 domain-containing protein n=1 Tax=Pseudonocardia pini TaxID=2758030 RepID=UPI0015F029A6|nr:hypothetical protein [Pseudonocardia pini]